MAEILDCCHYQSPCDGANIMLLFCSLEPPTEIARGSMQAPEPFGCSIGAGKVEKGAPHGVVGVDLNSSHACQILSSDLPPEASQTYVSKIVGEETIGDRPMVFNPRGN